MPERNSAIQNPWPRPQGGTHQGRPKSRLWRKTCSLSYFLFLSVINLREFQGPFAAGALKYITPSGSFRNRWGFSFVL